MKLSLPRIELSLPRIELSLALRACAPGRRSQGRFGGGGL